MKAIVIAVLIFSAAFIALVWNFPWPLEGWYDYVYAFFTGAIGVAIYGLIKLARQLLNND